MSLLTAVPARPNFYSAQPKEPRRSSPSSIRLRGALLIGSASLILALATAMECKSITHLPSLLYGLILWGWWGIIASTLWLTGLRSPSALDRSYPAIALQVLIACSAGVVHLILLSSLGLFIPEWETHAAPAIKVLTGLLNPNRFGL